MLECGADSERGGGANDAAAAEEPRLDVDKVHRAIPTPAEAVHTAGQVSDDRRERQTAPDGVPVWPVRARHLVAVAERGADAGGDGLLADLEMDEAGDTPGVELPLEPLLEVPMRSTTRFSGSITKPPHVRAAR
jgi:hypothetical protein